MRLPLLDEWITRCPIPEDLEEVTTVREGAEVYPPAVGVTAEAVDHIWAAVQGLYLGGAHPAISLCVRRRGRVLLDRAIGHRSGNAPDDPPDGPRVVATPDTPFCLLSASKSVTAILMHHLDEQGVLNLDDPVCEYIPEFANAGKETITLQQLLTHRAGVPNPPAEMMVPEILERPEEIVELLCEEAPLWRPGTRIGYHAVTSGFLFAEVVRRVTGSDLREYLRRVIRDPLRMRWMNYGVEADEVSQVASCAFTGVAPFPPISTLAQRALGVEFRQAIELINDPRFLTSLFPSANVVATADELCRFFEMLRRGGTLDGRRIIDRRTVVRATAEQSYQELDMTLLLPFRYGSGFMLGAEWFSLYGPFTRHAFGHLGLTNLVSWADPEREVSAALLTSGKPILYPELFYLFEILRRIGSACPADGPVPAVSPAAEIDATG